MNELFKRDLEFNPQKVLDFGAGLGSFSWAALDTYKNSIKTIAAVEPNGPMRKLGKFMTKNLEPEILWVDALSMIPGIGGSRGKFDLVMMGNVLSEIPTPNARELILQTLLDGTNEYGHLVLVEPGTPKGFGFINDFGNMVIEGDRSEINIVAPCPHHHKCPMAEKSDTWCHFKQTAYKYPKGIFPKNPGELN